MRRLVAVAKKLDGVVLVVEQVFHPMNLGEGSAAQQAAPHRGQPAYQAQATCAADLERIRTFCPKLAYLMELTYWRPAGACR